MISSRCLRIAVRVSGLPQERGLKSASRYCAHLVALALPRHISEMKLHDMKE